MLGEIAQLILDDMKKYKVLEEEINQLRQDRISKQDECKLISKNLEEIKSEINNTLLQAKEKENEISSHAGKIQEKEGQWESEKQIFLSYIKDTKEYLGLEILSTKTQSYIFSLTKVDKRDLDRKFLCEISLHGEDPNKHVYKVSRTLPEVDSLDTLVNVLNETGDLSGFIVTLRRKFEALA